ncbi:DegT/DnrJ/EryC1/StrS family aminotransferase [Candidatus Altiarchaeota archaeon]
MIPLSQPTIDEQEEKVVLDVLRSGRLSLGPYLTRFEEEFAKLIGVTHAVGVNSGTSGLHLCVKSLGIGRGDEVITSPFSFIASANCILYEGAKPVFVDIEEETFNIDPKLVGEAVTDDTKAILPVHVFGQCCDMGQIMGIAEKKGFKVIEDACESIGSTHKGGKAGSFGDASVFAFYPNKQMTTGEGGMIVTDDDDVARLCKSYSNQGRATDMQWLNHERIGYNYRMGEINAAIGCAQLDKLDHLLERRKKIAKLYSEGLEDVSGLILPKIKKGNDHTWFVYPLRVEDGIGRDKMISKLADKGVSSKAYFFPAIHLQPFYMKEFGYNEGDFPVAEKVSKSTFILPLFAGLDEDSIGKVIKAVIECLREVSD